MCPTSKYAQKTVLKHDLKPLQLHLPVVPGSSWRYAGMSSGTCSASLISVGKQMRRKDPVTPIRFRYKV